MSIWQLILSVDSERDFASLDSAQGWSLETFARWTSRINSDPSLSELAFAIREIGFQETSERDRAEWADNVAALRSCAKRLRGFETRASSLIDSTADEILRSHVARLKTRMPHDIPVQLNVASYAPQPPDVGGAFAVSASVFWQVVFGSLVFDSFCGVCTACFKDLGKTPLGKPRKGDFCKSCMSKQSFEKLPVEVQKRLTRERQSKYREKLRKLKEGGDAEGNP